MTAHPPQRKLKLCLNQVTAPRLALDEFLDLAARLGCYGVELRNDLGRPLFDGVTGTEAARETHSRGLKIVGLAQVYPFNEWSGEVHDALSELITAAGDCDAPAIALIPRNDGTGCEDGARQRNLRNALEQAQPLLDRGHVRALIEPLGFSRASLRLKSEAVDAINAIGGHREFGIIHDTFHHHLAGGDLFVEHTAMIHVSGVVDQTVHAPELDDSHRGLVDQNDRLGSLSQVAALVEGGYDGPISVEAFSPAIQGLDDPFDALQTSLSFILSQLTS